MARRFDVTIATCDPKPHADPDEPLLLEGLRDAGLEARTAAWDAPDIDWSASHLTVIRSTWDYYHDHQAFLAWSRRVASESALRNPADVVAWNSHKSYLIDFQNRGLPVIPTELVEAGSNRSLERMCGGRGWTDIVVKPAVSAGSHETHRLNVDRDSLEVYERLAADHDLLVQPYVSGMKRPGERSLICIDGRITHSITKAPRFDGDDQSVSGPHPVEPDQRRLAEQTLELVDTPLLYARVDMAPDDDGRYLLTELELIEPSLFLDHSERALERLVSAIADQVDRVAT